MNLSVYKNPDDIGESIAVKLIENIVNFSPTEEHPKLIIGLSWGRTMDRVLNNFLFLVKKNLEEGNPINLSDVLFLQTESFWPENPDSESNMMANQIKQKFELPLKFAGLEPKIYYPGTEKNAESARDNFGELSKDMDIDLVTVHESGAAKGLRDADELEDGKIRYAAGRLTTRDIQMRDISKIRAGENATINQKKFFRSEKDKPQDQAIQEYETVIQKGIQSGDNTALMPKYFISEGYKAYKSSKQVWIITEGNGKQIAVERMFQNIRLEGMSEEEMKEISQQRRENSEGTASIATVIDLRRGLNTEVFIDEEAAQKLDLPRIEKMGVHVSTPGLKNETRTELKNNYGTIEGGPGNLK